MRTQTHRAGRSVDAIVYACLAAVLCGCNQFSGHMANQTGLGYYRRGNFAMAQQEFHRALADDPNNHVSNVAKALLLAYS